MTLAPVLNLFDPGKDITLTVDASSISLGAALLQDGGPVEYTAKALTGAQINYAQIEKELQAIVFGCERFHSYIYGREVTVETGHKPLIGVFNKQIDTASPRIQIMMLRLQRYDFKQVYKPGKELYIADTLNCTCQLERQPRHDEREEDDPLKDICAVIVHLEKSRKTYKDATRHDPQLQDLLVHVRKG